METESENIKKIFKALAALFVFLASFSVPVLICRSVEEDARNARIRMDMGQIRNWAEVYELKNKTYEGLGDNPELKRSFNDIGSMGGSVSVFVGEQHDSYCARVFFRKGSFCVDSSGYAGKDRGICSSAMTNCD